MQYIKDMREGGRVHDIYLCKHKAAAVTKTGKPYENVILQDKTGSLDAKIWDPNSPGIGDFDAMEYVEVCGDLTSFQGVLQLSIKRARVCREGEYDPAEYVPVSSRDIQQMYQELKAVIASLQYPGAKALMEAIFIEDQDFAKRFCQSSAAKSVHHGFVGGLLEHTLNVLEICQFLCKKYDFLNRDLLLCAAMCHDLGKVMELSPFPHNDYTDQGQLLGHIMMGSFHIGKKAESLPQAAPAFVAQLQHCVLSHHGKLEFGSPKTPSIVEAVALSHADDMDAKLQTFKEYLDAKGGKGWLGYNRLFESNLRVTEW